MIIYENPPWSISKVTLRGALILRNLHRIQLYIQGLDWSNHQNSQQQWPAPLTWYVPDPAKKRILRQVRVICFIEWWFKLQHFATLQTLPFNLRWFINCGVFHPDKCVFPSWNQPWCFSSLSTELLDLSPPIQLTAKEIQEEPRENGSVSLCSFDCFLCGIPHSGQTHSYLLNQRLHVKEGGPTMMSLFLRATKCPTGNWRHLDANICQL